MSKLLRADFARLRSDKVMWIFTAGMLLMSVFTMAYSIRANMHFPNYEEYSSLEHVAFKCTPFIGIFCSVIISMFLGNDYSFGTLRNKIVAGYTRSEIYITSLIVSAAISEITAISWLVGVLIGVPYFGLGGLEPKRILTDLLLVFLYTAAWAAIFNLLGMIITSRTVSAVTSIFVSFVILLLGSYLYNSLLEPETINDVLITGNGIQMGDEMPNPDYIGGAKRVIYYLILNIIPAGQVILMANALDTGTIIADPILGTVGSILIIMISTICGVIIFRRKDLK